MEDRLYVVIELQKNRLQMSNLVTSHTTLHEAQHKFHTVAAAAAISNVEKHTVVLLDDDGFPMECNVFVHESEE